MPEAVRLIIEKAETPNVFFVSLFHGFPDYIWTSADLRNIQEWVGKLLDGKEKQYFTPELRHRIYTEEKENVG